MIKARQGETETIKQTKSMFETGMFEKEQSFTCLMQPPLLHKDSSSRPSEPVHERMSLFL